MDESLAVAKSPIVLNPSNAERPERSLSLSSPSVPIDCLVFDSRGQRLAAVSKRTDTVFVGKVDELVRNALSNIQRSDLWMALNFSAQHLPTSAQWRPISCPAMLAVAANNCALIWRLNSNQSNGPVVRVLNVPSAAVALAWAPHGLHLAVAHTYGVSIFDVEGVPIVELSAGVASPLSALCWTSDWLVGAGICGTRVWHCSNRWMATDFDIETPSTLARIQPLSVGLLALDDGVVAYFTGQTIKVMCTAKLCPLALWESPNEMINGLYTNNTGGGGGGNSGGTSTKLCSLLADGSVAISAIAPAPQWTLAPVRHLLMSSNVSACALRPFDSLAALVMSDGSILFVPLD